MNPLPLQILAFFAGAGWLIGGATWAVALGMVWLAVMIYAEFARD